MELVIPSSPSYNLYRVCASGKLLCDSPSAAVLVGSGKMEGRKANSSL